MANFRNRSVNVHQFSMIPRADIPRSSFRMEKAYKTTFDADYLIPIFCEEVLPGDSFNGKFTAYVRTETMIYPIMDNLHLETFFFFVPNRLVWFNWQRFMGEQSNPGDSIDYNIPTVPMDGSGLHDEGTVFDYFGMPLPSALTSPINVNALPFRGYALIFNEWFRDQNLVSAAAVYKDDGPDPISAYGMFRRGKRHDYFTSALPWTQKGDPVSLPLGQTAIVLPGAVDHTTGANTAMRMYQASGAGAMPAGFALAASAQGSPGGIGVSTLAATGGPTTGYPSNLYADLSEATATTINQIRQAFQIQKLLERDARGGTRYTEIVRSHFGVLSPDARLQRPEYIGGGYQSINVHQVAQTSATASNSSNHSDTPLGALAAFGTSAGSHRFNLNATEHGYIIGIANVRADLTYQRGLRKHWSRKTRYDYYFPVFAALGEQAVLNKEIFVTGTASDEDVFGYQERWAEYRYMPSEITGAFRSNAAETLDAWHLSQEFGDVPTLGQAFIESNTPMSRVLATGTTAPQFILDGLFSLKVARPMPMYGVPGLVDHF